MASHKFYDIWYFLYYLHELWKLQNQMQMRLSGIYYSIN